MRRTPLTNLNSMLKIKKGVDPVGTLHRLPLYDEGGKLIKPTYKVYAVHGANPAIPSDGITVFLKYADGRLHRTENPVNCVTLEYLASDFEAVSESDVFWE